MRIPVLVLLLCLLIACNESEETETPTVADVSINDLGISEGDQKAKLVSLDITFSEPPPHQIAIDYLTEDGTSVAGEDYNAANGQLVFEPGDMREILQVSILGDNEVEEDEIFYIHLAATSEHINFIKETATITIVNDDAEPFPSTGELVIPETGYSTPDTYDGMVLIWSDEFDEEALNLADWTYEVGTGSNGWGNNELQYYTNENVSIVEGHLVIEARRESRKGRQYTSSRIVTQDKQAFQYGRIDIRATLPYGQGIWPALWMLGSNFGLAGWPACGEIDIMEMIGGNNREKTVHGTVHWSNAGSYASYGGFYDLSSGIFADEFHVFSVVWDQNAIKWYVDDDHFHTIDISGAELNEFRQEFFFIFNVAVGGNWPGSPNNATPFPQRMIVDYVRVFQPD